MIDLSEDLEAVRYIRNVLMFCESGFPERMPETNISGILSDMATFSSTIRPLSTRKKGLTMRTRVNNTTAVVTTGAAAAVVLLTTTNILAQKLLII